MPKAVMAALRTLQAFGNYAVHYEKGAGRRPAAGATKSTMASLGLVVEWFLHREHDAGGPDHVGPIQLAVRSSKAPGLLERWRIGRRAWVVLPTFKLEGEATRDAMLGAMLTFYSQSVAVCARICREVLRRETELDADACDVDALPQLMEQVADLCPSRVPRSVAADIAELWRRRAFVTRAVREPAQDVAHVREELKHRDPAKDVARWFERQYLKHTHFERFWWVYVLLVLGWWLVRQERSEWQSQGRNDYRQELRERYCGQGAVSASPICLDLSADVPK